MTATPSERAYRVTIHGRVTGVGFRWSAWREAARHPALKGRIRNADAHTVECIVQGPAPEVAAMLDWLRHGPPGAHVERCDAVPLPPSPDEPPFRIEA